MSGLSSLFVGNRPKRQCALLVRADKLITSGPADAGPVRTVLRDAQRDVSAAHGTRLRELVANEERGSVVLSFDAGEAGYVFPATFKACRNPTPVTMMTFTLHG